MKKYLVTGAAGFVGAALAKKLISKGHKVYTIDNLSTGYESSIPIGVELLKGNVQDPILIESLEKHNFECVFHIAGQSSGEISYDDPVYDLQTNTQSTLLLLKMCLNTKCKKFIYASSMSVYGDILNEAACENHIPIPKSFYGVGKLASENYLRIFSDYGLICTSLRLCNIYGPGQNMQNLRQGMVSIFLQQALHKNEIIVKGSKERFRDFIYIDDVVDGFIECEKNNIAGYKCYNLTNNKKITVEELIFMFKEIFNKNIKVKYSGNTPGDQFGVYGNNSKILEETKWKPNYNLKKGLINMVNWAKNKSK